MKGGVGGARAEGGGARLSPLCRRLAGLSWIWEGRGVGGERRERGG